jgi:RimJ/RimL family protein N-acetyltransferase
MIETRRFLLRRLTPDDASERYRSWFNEDTARMGIVAARRPQTLESLREFIAARANRADVLFLGIFVKATGLHIGNIKYEPLDRAAGYAVMGILIGEPDWWARGAAAEVIEASGRWLRDHAGIEEIVLGVAKDNVRARRSYEKVGFRACDTGRIEVDPGLNQTMVWRP